jgi:hypothetical protein
VRRALALGTGLSVGALYIASAVLSGHLSPLARRPLLDGLAPPVPYRWVEPPPELASTNVPPARQRFPIELEGSGSATASITTDDAQVTLIFPRGAFATAPQQRSVQVTIEPLGPSSVGAPDPPTVIVGNVYGIDAAYRPSGAPATLEVAAQVVLVYPLVANDHGGHDVLVSTDGETWTPVVTNDLPSVLQADGSIETLGYVTIGGEPPSPTSSPSGPGSGAGWSTAAIVIAGAIVALLVGAAYVLWPSPGGRSGRRR